MTARLAPTNRWLTLLVNAGIVLALILLIAEVRQNSRLLRASLESDSHENATADTAAAARRPEVPVTPTSGRHQPGTRALDCVGTGRDAATAGVARQRTLFNRAIEAADTQLLAGVLAEDVVLVTGSDSDLYRGRDEQLALWRSGFADPARLIYLRTPECIRLSPSAPLAVEYGSWQGRSAAAAAPSAGGSYTAKWRQGDDGWRLEAEVFTTDFCSEGYCPSRRAGQPD